MREVCLFCVLLALWIPNTNALVGPNRPKGSLPRAPVTFHSESSSFRRSLVVLEAKKKKRRRKEAPKAPASTEAPSPAAPPAAPPASATVSQKITAEPVPDKPVVATAPVDVVAEKPAPAMEAPKVESAANLPSPPSPEMDMDDDEEDDEDEDDDTTEEELSSILEVAKFKFEPDDAITRGGCVLLRTLHRSTIF